MKSFNTNRLQKTALAAAIAMMLAGGQLTVLQSAYAGTAAIAGQSLHPASFSGLIKEVKPAVVSVITTSNGDIGSFSRKHGFRVPGYPESSPFQEFFGRFFDGMPMVPEQGKGYTYKGTGSGFIISGDGHVVTNHHVISGASEIQVILENGTKYSAEVKGVDSKTDLALLKIEAEEPLPFVEMGDSGQADVGDWVLAVGNQFGLGGTATAGIISARGRDIQSGPFDDFLQFDAPINRGNSGGPLFDTSGRVIGINTAILSPSGGHVGVGFAIPSNIAKDVIAQLQQQGEVSRGWLGVQIQPVTEEIAESLGMKEASGVLIAGVVEESPASSAGFKPGDVIITMNGEKLADHKQLSQKVANTEAGSRVNFEISRGGERKQIEVSIGSLPSEEVKVSQAGGKRGSAELKLGIQLAPLVPEMRQQYNLSDDSSGVFVVDVEAGSPASKAGIRRGNVINMVGDKAVNSPGDVVDQVRLAAERKREAVLLRIEDRGRQRFVAVKFAST